MSYEESLLQGKDQLLEVDTTAFGDSNPFSGQGQGAQDGPPPPYESVIMHDGTRGDTTVGLSSGMLACGPVQISQCCRSSESQYTAMLCCILGSSYSQDPDRTAVLPF